MNYLGHYVYNHHVGDLPAEPYFVLGVALPDLWPRFSRRRRLRWRAVRAARPRRREARQLRAGLLNHVAADRRFHTCPAFIRWQRTLRVSAATAAPTPPGLDIAAHIAVELALDHVLVRREPSAAERFYDQLACCDVALAEQIVGVLGDVDARGLGVEIRGFVARRFLRRFARCTTLAQVLRYILSLTSFRGGFAFERLCALTESAVRIVEPEKIWAEMGPVRQLDRLSDRAEATDVA